MTPERQQNVVGESAPKGGDGLAVGLRLVVYVVLAGGGLLLFSLLLVPFGYLTNATLSVLLAAVCANFLCLRIYHQLPLEAVGWCWNRAGRRHLGLGLGMGAAAALGCTLLPAAVGAARFRAAEEPFAWGTFLFVSVLLGLGAAGEELFFRGYGFQILLRALGPWVVIAPVGMLFAALHAQNPHATALGLVNTALWGVVLGYAFWRSGDLWLATGLHFGWNYTLALVGVNVSGFTMRLSGYELDWKAGELISGGAYGPEGGLPTTVAGIVVLAALWRAPVEKQPAFPVSSGGEE